MNKNPLIGNVGGGAGIFSSKTNANLHQLKSLVAGSNVTITPGADEIQISASGGGGASTRTEWIPARAFTGAESGGTWGGVASDPATSKRVGQHWNYSKVEFQAGNDQAAAVVIPFPGNWNGSNIGVSIYWFPSGTSTGICEWYVDGYFLRDLDAMNGPAQNLNPLFDAGAGSANTMQITSGSFSPQGTYSATGTALCLQIERTGTTDAFSNIANMAAVALGIGLT